MISAFLVIVGLNSANAGTLVMEGSIEQLTYDNHDITKDTISVDYWNFSVEESGIVTIDVLSWERDPDEWFWRDVNNDGEDSFIDSSIHVFKGSLAQQNIYASNDDDKVNGRDDGSIRGNDSFISQDFETGDYILAISSCGYGPYFSMDEAVDGVNQKAIIPYSQGEGDLGDYRITISGNVSSVPLPGALWLLGSGILGLAGLNRKKQNPTAV